MKKNVYVFQRGLVLKGEKKGLGEEKSIQKIVIFKSDIMNAVCMVHGTFNVH